MSQYCLRRNQRLSMTSNAKKPDPEIAKQALAEARERRKMEKPAEPAKEIAGREGPDPARYGDWENKGIASDF